VAASTVVSDVTVCHPRLVANTVVVVDDDEGVREAIADVLELDGYKVLTARDGVEALRVLLQAPRPCVALVDLVMPRVDGWQLARAIANEPGLRDIPVICCTAGRAEFPIECHAVLRKPFDDETLSAVVRGAFAEVNAVARVSE
jgi:chemosensory pili system protein ChpA (sensor histidine kinase/response regulator)